MTRDLKPTILTIARYYLPGFRAGGPIRSIANLVECLRDQYDFKIVTCDRDLGDKQPFRNSALDHWANVGNVQVHYTPTGVRALVAIARVLRKTPHDILYLNSFFDPIYSLWPLVIRRFFPGSLTAVVIAPRGELSPGALKIKRWKKSPFLALMRRSSIHRRVIWQASSELEALNIIGAMGSSYVTGDAARAMIAPDITSPAPTDLWAGQPLNIVIAPNVAGTDSSTATQAESDGHGQSEPLRICFLSRISPMKNLDYALRVLTHVRAPVRFAIYGPLEDSSYWELCQRLITSLPTHVEVSYRGIVEPDRVVATFAEHDLFFFPTRGENFGHVIHESLRAGTPALLSDQTSWLGLESCGIGASLPLAKPEGFVRVIEDMANWGLARRNLARQAARDYARMIDANSGAVEANRTLFASALNSRR
jgi:glycosyltransferase involved in cell wall biosynthesis